MANDQVWHLANIPAGSPTHDNMVNSCAKAGSNRNGVCIRVAGEPRFWVKYVKDSVIRGEGHTQAHVAGIVNANGNDVVMKLRGQTGLKNANMTSTGPVRMWLAQLVASCRLPQPLSDRDAVPPLELTES